MASVCGPFSPPGCEMKVQGSKHLEISRRITLPIFLTRAEFALYTEHTLTRVILPLLLSFVLQSVIPSPVIMSRNHR